MINTEYNHNRLIAILKPFNCVKTNDLYQIELLVLDKNTWNHLSVRKQIINPE